MNLRILALFPLPFLLVVLADFSGILLGSRSVADCSGGTALVMGAAQYDGKPSPAFERRLARALERYEAGCSEFIVVSGGKRAGDRFSEGQTGVSWLAGNGVPASALAAEERAASSWQNISYSKELLSEPLVIVTDDLHAFRTLWVASRHGFDAQADTVRAGGVRSTYLLRELLGMLGYQMGLGR